MARAPRSTGPASPRTPDRLDQIPLAHLRSTADVLPLRDLVQLLAVPVLEAPPGLAAALTTLGCLLAELAASALRQVGNRLLAPRPLLCLLDVSLRCPALLGGRHGSPPSGCRMPTPRRFGQTAMRILAGRVAPLT